MPPDKVKPERFTHCLNQMSLSDTPLTKIDIQPLSAATAAFARLPNGQAVKTHLREVILRRSETYPAAAQSNLGRCQPSKGPPKWLGQEITLLLSFVWQLAKKFTAGRAGQPVEGTV